MSRTQWTRMGMLAIAVAAAAWAATSSNAHAGKPGGGGGGGTAADGGFVWYLEFGAMTRMRADGSEKTTLPVPGKSLDYTFGGTAYNDQIRTIDVSRTVHGPSNDRWLLYVLPIDDGLWSPAGIPHHEVFALRERDGARLQLTDGTVVEAGVRRIAVEPDIQRSNANPTILQIIADPSFSRLGSAEDGRVTYFARAWTAAGFPTDPGLYGVEVDLGVGTTMQTQSPALLTSVGMSFRTYSGALPWSTWTFGTPCDINGTHDWSADGRTVVWENGAAAVASMSTTTWDAGGSATTTFLRSSPYFMFPQVNAANGRILYFGVDPATGKSDVRTMAADGAAETVLVAPSANNAKTATGLWPPVWSPSGTWVAYGSWSRNQMGVAKSDVLQIPAGGGSTTNPTSSGSEYAVPVAWRN